MKKVLAYVTRGNTLLVFEHRAHPEAGFSVSTGIVKDSGLATVRIASDLGSDQYDLADSWDEVQARDVCHLGVEEEDHPCRLPLVSSGLARSCLSLFHGAPRGAVVVGME